MHKNKKKLTHNNKNNESQYKNNKPKTHCKQKTTKQIYKNKQKHKSIINK